MSSNISIIVPIYNAERSLRRCIDSILAQTYTDFELLLVDDGSTDGSGAICDEYAAHDPRVRVFHKSNGGVSSARNVGLDNIQGNWVTFVDADDYVFPEWLQNYGLDNVGAEDIISQGLEFRFKTNGDNERISIKSFSFEGEVDEYIDKCAEFKLFGFLFIKCFRANIILKKGIRFDENIKFQEDELFVSEFLKYAGCARSIDKIGYCYYCIGWHRYNPKDIYDNNRNEKIVNNLKIVFRGNSNSNFLSERNDNLIICLIREYQETKNKKLLERIRQHFSEIKFSRFPNIVNTVIEKDSTNILLRICIAGLSLYKKWK